MKLHLYRDDFEALLLEIRENSNYRDDVIEKDYYVTLLLKELSAKQATLPAYFKGGTALYKAMNSIRRFSEDIDLTVSIDDCSNSGAKKRLENSAKYTSLNRTISKDLESNNKGSIITVYDYNTICDVKIDPLQRFSKVKVESTSFTVSEPFEAITIEPIIYTLATKVQQKILEEKFEVMPFEINAIKMERIFADKIFAAEFYYTRTEYFDVSKHIYDISVLLKTETIQKLLHNKDNLVKMIGYKRKEETNRIGSDLADKSFEDFSLFKEIKENINLKKEFHKMQEIYVFNEKDNLQFENVCEDLEMLTNILFDLDEKLAEDIGMHRLINQDVVKLSRS